MILAPPANPTPGLRPTFSVVIATYQAAKLVPDAVRSALAQTLPAHEIIVCDDGSTDDPASALAPWRDRITLIRQENRGEAGARNTLARAASGDYLAILDADDTFEPGRLAALADALAQRPDLDILTTDAWIELGGRRVRRVYEQGYAFAARDQRTAILRGNFIVGLCAVRRERVLAVGGYDEAIRHACDWELWVRMILDGSVAGCLMEPLATYRLQPGSLSSERARMLAGEVRILEKTARRDDLSAAERQVLDDALRDRRSRLALARAREALRTGAPEARRLALAAAVSGGQAPLTRLKLAAAVAAPRAVGRRLRGRPYETSGGLIVAPTGREPARP